MWGDLVSVSVSIRNAMSPKGNVKLEYQEILVYDP